MQTDLPCVLAGVPQTNRSLYHKIQFSVGDSVAWVGNYDLDQSLLLVRDIEIARAKDHAQADQIGCSNDFPVKEGLSGDRDTALAQALAEALIRKNILKVSTDRSLPFLFAWHLNQRGIELQYDPDLGVMDRRVKSETEIEKLRIAQSITCKAMEMACRLIANAVANKDGELTNDDTILTSESVRKKITQFLINEGFSTPSDSIVATLPHVADCHHFGTGPLKTGVPVIVDIFPRDESTFYNGDCTRTVVHGDPSDTVLAMHKAVQDAKNSGCQSIKKGVTGEFVHEQTVREIKKNGFEFIRGSSSLNQEVPAMRHGTGHGIGLDVHEPILLDIGGGELLQNEVFTVEPGLYSAKHGGIRIEDMVQVLENGYEILCPLHEGLDWSGN